MPGVAIWLAIGLVPTVILAASPQDCSKSWVAVVAAFATIISLAPMSFFGYVVAERTAFTDQDAVWIASKLRAMSRRELVWLCVAVTLFWELVMVFFLADWILASKVCRYKGWALDEGGQTNMTPPWIMYAVACTLPMISF